MTLRPAADAIATAIDGGAVVLNVRTRRYYSLNETGAFVWARIEAGTTRDAIVDALVHEYEVTAATASAAVARIVDELAIERLVEEE